MPHVMVISSEGYLYLYSIDLENGGECGLVKQYRCVVLFVIALFLPVRLPFLLPRSFTVAFVTASVAPGLRTYRTTL